MLHSQGIRQTVDGKLDAISVDKSRTVKFDEAGRECLSTELIVLQNVMFWREFSFYFKFAIKKIERKLHFTATCTTTKVT